MKHISLALLAALSIVAAAIPLKAFAAEGVAAMAPLNNATLDNMRGGDAGLTNLTLPPSVDVHQASFGVGHPIDIPPPPVLSAASRALGQLRSMRGLAVHLTGGLVDNAEDLGSVIGSLHFQ